MDSLNVRQAVLLEVRADWMFGLYASVEWWMEDGCFETILCWLLLWFIKDDLVTQAGIIKESNFHIN